MARTWHHDKRRFHPWKSGRWPEWRTGWYYINYADSPSWWRRLHETKPQRREAHMMEAKCLRVDPEDVFGWPLARKPTVYYW